MTARRFAQLDCTLASSKKIRGLKNGAHKWAYLCAHLSPLGSFRGIFRYPLSVFADDAQMTPDELKIAIDDMVACNLIEYDCDEELIRIVGWFRKKNGPENPSVATGMLTDFANQPHSNVGMEVNSLAEFTVAVLRRSLNWKPESQTVLRERLRTQLDLTYQFHGEVFLVALANEVEGFGRKIELELGALLPPFLKHRADTVSTPCPHNRLDETRPRKDRDKEKDLDVLNSLKNANPALDGNAPVLRKTNVESSGPRPETLKALERMGP